MSVTDVRSACLVTSLQCQRESVWCITKSWEVFPQFGLLWTHRARVSSRLCGKEVHVLLYVTLTDPGRTGRGDCFDLIVRDSFLAVPFYTFEKECSSFNLKWRSIGSFCVSLGTLQNEPFQYKTPFMRNELNRPSDERQGTHTSCPHPLPCRFLSTIQLSRKVSAAFQVRRSVSKRMPRSHGRKLTPGTEGTVIHVNNKNIVGL